MADRTAEFALELKDEASGAADSVANALSNLRRTIEGDQRELGAMQKAMRNLQSGTTVNVESFRRLKSQIDAKRESIVAAESQYINLGGTFSRVSGQSRGLEAKLASLQKQIVDIPKAGDKLPTLNNRFASLRDQAANMPGPLGRVGGSLGRIGALVAGGGAIAIGVLAIVAALAALAVASVVAVGALAKYGIAQADARRSELLRLEGLAKLRTFYQRMPGNANEMQVAIDKVSGVTALGRGELEKYTNQLYRMGLRGGNLTQALEGVAIKAATQGDEAAQVFAGWAAGAALSGRSIGKLVDDVRARLGPLAAKQMLSLDVQARKLKESISALFDDVKIEYLLGGIKTLTDLFSTSTASGKALKQIVEVLMRPLIEDLTAATPLIKRFFQGMILATQDVVIAILKLRIWLRDTFGDSKLLKDIDGLSIALGAGKIMAYGLAAGLGLAAVALTTIAAVLAIPFALLVGIGLIANEAWEAMIEFGARVHKFFTETDWKALGMSIVNGIVEAITGIGTSKLVNAMKGLGGVAIDAFKLALGISSPSKAFEKLGLAIPAGVEVGIAAGSPAAREAAGEIVESPPPTGSTGRGAAGGGRGATFTFGDFHFHGVEEQAGRELADDFILRLTEALEGVAVEVGAR